MKLTCDIVQDLLPLYEDGACSPASRAAVEEHLQTCPVCQGEIETAQKLPEQEILPDIPGEKKSVQSLKKIRRRWAASLLIVALLIPMVLLTVNQIRGVGICFTNPDDILLAKKFVRYIQNGAYSKAAGMYDFRGNYQDILDVLSSSPEDNMPSFHACKIGDEIWYIHDSISEYIQLDYDTKDVWNQLIFNSYHGVLIPREQMDAFTAQEPEAVTYENDGYTVNGRTYLPYDTPWGQFLVEDTVLNVFLQSDMELQDYGYHFTLMPEEMYLDILSALQADALSIHEATMELYSCAADMTEEEFCTYMQEKYAADLEAAFSQVTMIGNRYTVSYRIDSSGYSTSENGWTVGIQCYVTYEDYPITIYVHIKGGKVTGLSMSYADDNPLIELITDALFPSYY